MKDLITKRELCRKAIKLEDWKKSFKLAKGFDAIFSKEDIESLSISYECLVGNENFYKSLKYDTDSIIFKAKSILLKYLDDFENEK